MVPLGDPSFFVLVAVVGGRFAGSVVPAARVGARCTQSVVGGLPSLRGPWC
jgi:hypothetical protein